MADIKGPNAWFAELMHDSPRQAVAHLNTIVASKREPVVLRFVVPYRTAYNPDGANRPFYLGGVRLGEEFCLHKGEIRPTKQRPAAVRDANTAYHSRRLMPMGRSFSVDVFHSGPQEPEKFELDPWGEGVTMTVVEVTPATTAARLAANGVSFEFDGVNLLTRPVSDDEEEGSLTLSHLIRAFLAKRNVIPSRDLEHQRVPTFPEEELMLVFPEVNEIKDLDIGGGQELGQSTSVDHNYLDNDGLVIVNSLENDHRYLVWLVPTPSGEATMNEFIELV